MDLNAGTGQDHSVTGRERRAIMGLDPNPSFKPTVPDRRPPAAPDLLLWTAGSQTVAALWAVMAVLTFPAYGWAPGVAGLVLILVAGLLIDSETLIGGVVMLPMTVILHPTLLVMRLLQPRWRMIGLAHGLLLALGVGVIWALIEGQSSLAIAGAAVHLPIALWARHQDRAARKAQRLTNEPAV